ncbi:hypothetical protein N6H05_15175 [Sphingobium sp. WTD-1]|uniref:hypothetical protein n=1 Tax=Sphingobium sp. WTD-1 TaxID=2979467 RepID=UPI0024DE2DA0|nr:hypothetical protein [Sphingobium sp. WTD-1]WIA54403.1 hypothetical protein N6H05_15175 [Sphingobium sp. WTD-1]
MHTNIGARLVSAGELFAVKGKCQIAYMRNEMRTVIRSQIVKFIFAYLVDILAKRSIKPCRDGHNRLPIASATRLFFGHSRKSPIPQNRGQPGGTPETTPAPIVFRPRIAEMLALQAGRR